MQTTINVLLGLGSLLASLAGTLSDTITYVSPPLVHAEVVVTPEPETIEAQISRIASEVGIASTTLYNLALTEGGLKADPPGYNDGGKACGVVQIHASEWGFDCQELKDKPEIGLRFAAEHIREGTASLYWTPCSCVKSARVKVPSLPRGDASQLQPNSNILDGQVVILNYNGTRHIAVKEAITQEGLQVYEGNKEPCLASRRLIPWSELDTTLVGYWSSQGEVSIPS